MNKKVLSILGCGWLGIAVAKQFVQRGWHVQGSTTSPEKIASLSALGIDPFLIQLTPQPNGENLDKFFDADVLLVSIPPRRKAGLTDVYVAQMESLAEFLTAVKTRNVIFISSTSIYRDLDREVFEADADVSSYLFHAEQSLINNPSFKTTVLRFGGLVGDDRHPGKFLSGKQGIAGPTMPVNMIHQRDCVEVIFQIAAQRAFGEVFNACADLHPTKKEFYEAASRALKLPPPSFDESRDASFKVVNSDKLKTSLKYSFIYSDPMTMIA